MSIGLNHTGVSIVIQTLNSLDDTNLTQNGRSTILMRKIIYLPKKWKTFYNIEGIQSKQRPSTAINDLSVYE